MVITFGQHFLPVMLRGVRNKESGFIQFGRDYERVSRIFAPQKQILNQPYNEQQNIYDDQTGRYE
jgi:hypothetical protein